MSDSESVEKDDGSFLFDDDVHCDASIENAVYGSQSKSRRNNVSVKMMCKTVYSI